MFLVAGRPYDHPVAQAQYGLHLVESYRLSRDVRYLDRAGRQAQRLVERRVVHAGGWFYPYRYLAGLHNGPEKYPPPWFSMMAQGQALSLFCRLVEVTGLARWRAAADATFASYFTPAVAGQPWGVYVIDGRLWLEEYPHPRRVSGDRTYNGHIFSALGLWDYWVLTSNDTARLLLWGALTTARDMSARVRHPGWRSQYCLRHGADAGLYHDTHMRLHTQLHAITGDLSFASIADGFYRDFPPAQPGNLWLAGGTHTGYRLDDHQRVVASKTISLSRPATVATAGRTRIPQHDGIWYRIDDGDFAGYHVPESSGSYQLGLCSVLEFGRPRPARVTATAVTTRTVDATGKTTTTATTYRPDDPVTVNARGMLNGVAHLRLAGGAHANRWVDASAIDLPTRNQTRPAH